MSREDATYLVFENFLDLDTGLGISVSDDPQKIRPVLPKAPPYLIAGQVARVNNPHFRVHFAAAPTLAICFVPGGVLVHAATFGVLAAR